MDGEEIAEDGREGEHDACACGDAEDSSGEAEAHGLDEEDAEKIA